MGLAYVLVVKTRKFKQGKNMGKPFYVLTFRNSRTKDSKSKSNKLLKNPKKINKSHIPDCYSFETPITSLYFRRVWYD